MLKRRYSDEGGAVAVVVAIFIAFAVLGLASVSVDLGSLWSSQRAKVTDTDAMALAAAQVARVEVACTPTFTTPSSPPGQKNNDEVYQRALELGQANGVPEEDIESVEVRCEGDQRIVEVRAREDSPGWFSGRDDLSALGVTTVAAGSIPFDGLAFCQNFFSDVPTGTFNGSLSELEDFVADPAFDPDDDTTYAPFKIKNIVYKANENQLDPEDIDTEDQMLCDDDWGGGGSGTIPGGWGWLEKDPPLPYCGAAAGGDAWCDSDSGNNSVQGWLEPGDAFNFPIFEQAQGSGSNGEFLVTGVGQGVLIGCSGGGQPSLDDAPFEGSCGGNPNYMSVLVTAHGSLADYLDEIEPIIAPPPSVCGIRTTDGECSFGS